MDERTHVAAPRRVFEASGADYVQFVGTELTGATEDAVDRSMLDAFVELLGSSGVRPQVADVGCGPGRVAAFLSRHQLEVVGVDASPALLAFARSAHPHLRFQEGLLDDLPFDNGALGGVVCWYSIIYTPPELLGDVFAEIARVVMSNGLVLLAFQSGAGEAVEKVDAYGTGVTLTSYRHDVEAITDQLRSSGLEVHASAVRAPTLPHEQTPQAFVIARMR